VRLRMSLPSAPHCRRHGIRQYPVALITRGLAEIDAPGCQARRAARNIHGTRSGRPGPDIAPMINRATVDSAWRWAAANRRRWPNAIHQVVEGVAAARAVHHVAERLGVDMPICGKYTGSCTRTNPWDLRCKH